MGRLPVREPNAQNLALLIARAARHPRPQFMRCDVVESYHVPRNRGSIGGWSTEAVLRARRDFVEPQSARRSDRRTPKSCARRREPLRTEPGKRLGKTRLCRLASAGHSTRPTDFQLFSAERVTCDCVIDRHEQAGAIATTCRDTNTERQVSPRRVHRRASPAEDGKRVN